MKFFTISVMAAALLGQLVVPKTLQAQVPWPSDRCLHQERAYYEALREWQRAEDKYEGLLRRRTQLFLKMVKVRQDRAESLAILSSFGNQNGSGYSYGGYDSDDAFDAQEDLQRFEKRYASSLQSLAKLEPKIRVEAYRQGQWEAGFRYAELTLQQCWSAGG
jgi:hypothetical protein